MLCVNQDDLFLIAIWNFTGLREKINFPYDGKEFLLPGIKNMMRECGVW